MKPKIAIAGCPNVGKSVVFNALCRQYAVVSNYPGTSVEVTRGSTTIGGIEYEVIDTPGMYSLFPITEEERIARGILMGESPDVVLHIVDARNLERMLPMTLQLIDGGMRVVLVLNMMDEAEKDGIAVLAHRLSADLGVPVVAAAATEGRGIDAIKSAIPDVLRAKAEPGVLVKFPPHVEAAIAKAAEGESNSGLAPRMRALFKLHDGDVPGAPGNPPLHVDYHVAMAGRDKAGELVARSVTDSGRSEGFRDWLGRVTMHPVAGPPILLLVLYFGLYKFVGGFGAGTVVDLCEGLYEEYLNPAFTAIVGKLVPWPWLSGLFVGEYGILTLGVRYAVAIIMPLVTLFFLAFAVLEDSGYLPRLAMLIDRTFKKIGLSGRAVIPMVLGLGCDTMATMVARTLPTRRERVLATLLLALAVPCSAQLGLMLALLEGRPAPMLIWAGVIMFVFLLVGYLAAQVLPGERASFYIEVPPMRVPKPGNVLVKTYVRVKWYFREVLPLFILVSLVIWIGQLTGIFHMLVGLLETPVLMVGLPREAAEVFLFGFFRRDYGAAGLYDLDGQGLLNGRQLVVACVALTLFLPCVAQFLMNVKERGWKVGIAISAFVLFFAFAAAWILNTALDHLGVLL